MVIDNETFHHFREKRKQEILDRLEFHSVKDKDKCEIWIDPFTDKKYNVKIEVKRRFDDMKEASK